jgi:hypothetical protein
MPDPSVFDFVPFMLVSLLIGLTLGGISEYFVQKYYYWSPP